MAALAREFGLTGTADAIYIKVEPIFSKAFQTDVLNCLHNRRGIDFRHLSTGRTNLMTVVLVTIESFVFRDSLDMMTHHQTDIPKEVKRVVKRRPTDREGIFLFQFVFELLQGEMTFMVVDSAQNGITLWCLAMT